MYCNKCKIYVDTIGKYCPLCGSEIGENKNPSYPLVKHKINDHTFIRLISFIFIMAGVLCVFLNLIINPNVHWSYFVLGGLASSYIILIRVLRGRRRVIRLLFTLNILVLLLAFIWDYATGGIGWSLNFVLPSLCIVYGAFLVVLRFVNFNEFYDNSFFVYLNILLEFVPIILVHFHKITFQPFAYASTILGILNLLILLIFSGRKGIIEMKKKWHV